MSYELADHLVTPRTLYTHHGLYFENGYVFEQSQKGVNLVSLSDFSEGYDIYVKNRPYRAFSRNESIERASSRLGEDEYNLLFNNCEHFVNWCIIGINKSEQVDMSLEILERIYKEVSSERHKRMLLDYISDHSSIRSAFFSSQATCPFIADTINLLGYTTFSKLPGNIGSQKQSPFIGNITSPMDILSTVNTIKNLFK